MAHLGVTVALAGLAMCVLAGVGALWSYWRIPGTSAGVAVSAACGTLALAGALVAVAGAVISYG